jgi:hypothetical protein
MTKQKKLFNKTGDSVEIKEDGKDVIVTVQYTTKVEPTMSATQDNFNDMVYRRRTTLMIWSRFMKGQALPKSKGNSSFYTSSFNYLIIC